ncbi:sulfatase [Lentisphaera profundi]|uniref:Sulfatase n=1 Tax=Lentisphaera profundi TaxID=1658616 RepID=A0ABY7VYU4_9BACT|nr:sulfatase [Lentisphaera profundi]WDE99453.1 sulfatase [Lentisphaera profundi]
MFKSIRPYIVLSLLCLGIASDLLAKNQKPNILFIMSDDHTKQAIGAYGSRLAQLNPTPNIDYLAKNGMRFDQVFCNNSICTPSRASIITGQYPQSNGVLDLNGSISADKQYLPLVMKKAGYQTAMIGKWHLKKEPAAFDFYCVLPGQGLYHNPDFYVRGPKPWGKNILKSNKHSSDAITDISLDWLKNKRKTNQAFFLMHHFKAPHDMYENAKRYDSYLEEIDIPRPNNLFEAPKASPGSKDLGSGLSKSHNTWGLPQKLGISDELNEPEYTHKAYQLYLKRYLRCVKGIDDKIKRLIDYLTETGEIENTIIIYTSDQGFLLGEHNLIDKRWMYEESFSMPFIAYYPKLIKKNSVNHWLINNTDFAPTLLQLAGINNPPEYMQGKSFFDAFTGSAKPENWREFTYYRYWMHMAHRLAVPAHFGIRSERYKLIFFYGLKNGKRGGKPTPVAWEFYDLKSDPSEMVNQYANPEYQSIISKMKSQLKDLRIELKETDEKYPQIQKIIDAHWDK